MAPRSAPASAKKSHDDPLAFSKTMETVYADADSLPEHLDMYLMNGNQFWFVLPDGILPYNPEVEISVPFLRFTPEGRRANMLTRMMFSRKGGVVIDAQSGRKFLVEFRPCVLVGKSKEGANFSRKVAEFDGPSAPAPAPAAAAEEEGTKVPDIGEMLSGLQQTRKSLDAIDSLLAAPDSLMDADEGKRQALQETLSQTKDKALQGLGQLGDALARGGEQSLDEWRTSVTRALNATIEAMVSLDDLSEHLRDEKRQELEKLRQSMEAYFSSIDPKTDFEQCRKFSAGVNELILEERKETLEIKQVRLEKNLEEGYDGVMLALQSALGKGSTMALIPHPYVEHNKGFDALLVMNMAHVIMAVRYGGVSIQLDTDRFPRMHSELKGWDATRLPRIHICDQRRFASLRAAVAAGRA